ncbi:MAG TPA: FtsX-like permease family protein [Vicinamibacterales bacterium]
MTRLAFRFAWLRVRREPGRTALAVLGVAAIGALLFDMLLLSNGLLVSFRERLDRSRFDVRVMASDSASIAGPPIEKVASLVSALRRLPTISAVQRVSLGSADVEGRGAGRQIAIVGVDPSQPVPWTIAPGRARASSEAPFTIVVNRNVERQLGLEPGTPVSLRGRCGGAAPPLPLTVVVEAIADFQNDAADALSAALSYRAFAALCGGSDPDRADMLLVASRQDADQAAAAIRSIAPSLYVVTNAELVERFSRVEFSYFRQLSSVLTTVTLFFGLLLVAVLLTVSVNQQLGEIAALRALGLSRRRVVAGVFFESLLLVGIGGAVAVPLGAALSLWLDAILRSLPGIPADAHFFVFTPRAVVLHASLMAVGAVAAALYPMRLVATLPVAATLRREVGS